MTRPVTSLLVVSVGGAKPMFIPGSPHGPKLRKFKSKRWTGLKIPQEPLWGQVNDRHRVDVLRRPVVAASECLMNAISLPLQADAVPAKRARLAPTARQQSKRLSAEELDALFLARGTTQQGQLRIRHIRDNLPQRATKTSKYAGKLRYPSHKMGFVLESEAFSTEYVAQVEWEHDDDTLEIYPQPAGGLKITYRTGTSNRVVTTHITPDAFRITRTEFVFTECKTESWLEAEGIRQPNRFVQQTNGTWRSPPAEAAARELGCQFEIRSTAQNNHTLVENLELLRPYLTGKLAEVCQPAKEVLHSRFEGLMYASAAALVDVEPRISADDLYTLLVQREVYFPLHSLRLTDRDKALFFRSASDWNAHKIFVSADQPDRRRPVLGGAIAAGDTFRWHDIAYEVVHVDNTAIAARRLDGNTRLVQLSYLDFDRLCSGRAIVFDANAQMPSTEAQALFQRASPTDLQEATWRHEILSGKPTSGNPLASVAKRTVFTWKKAYRDAEVRWGNGLLGLLPQRHGNRVPKVSPETKALVLEVIANDWETIRRKQRMASFGRFLNLCTEKALDPVGYTTFCSYVKTRGGHGQSVARVGEKASYALEPQYLELTRSTPRHGTHSWHIGHIDHTPLPVKLLSTADQEFADRVWLTMLITSHDRKIRAYYLSFDEPSYRSCLMVMRDCVRRHGRVPQMIVTDGGSEFLSVYYETLLARLDCVKRERARSKARFGSVCERIFGTTQGQFVKTLLGATDIVEQNYRAISPEVDPKRNAVWVLDQLDTRFEEYIERVYHSNYHTGLDMTPNEAEALSLRSHGHRAFKRISYDAQFLAETCPGAQRGSVLVGPEGVKINYRWFKGEALSHPGVLGSRVDARFDPWNAGVAYVYLNRKWSPVYSEQFALFEGRTEREIKFATEALKTIAKGRGKRQSLNAQVLAQFMSTTEGQEATARQRRNDAESAVHRAKVVAVHSPAQAPTGLAEGVSNVVPLVRSSLSQARPRRAVDWEDL